MTRLLALQAISLRTTHILISSHSSSELEANLSELDVEPVPECVKLESPKNGLSGTTNVLCVGYTREPWIGLRLLCFKSMTFLGADTFQAEGGCPPIIIPVMVLWISTGR